MNTKTSAAGKATAAATRQSATKADAPQNKADGATSNKARTLTGETIADDADGHTDASTRAGAGAHEGNFTCRRELSGDREYRTGDARVGKVSDLAHLARSGAIAPADKATASALKDYAGVDADIVKPTSKAAEAAEEAEG